MNSEKQIKEWLESGVITPEQAKKMLTDVKLKVKTDKSNKFIVSITTIGSVLLGTGAILFVASNWDGIPDLVKVFMLLGSTFCAYYLGYLFKYDKKNLPRVGASLIFLGALLFGASVCLIAQIYNVNANAHSLVLIWMIGVLPLVYAFLSVPIAALSSLLFLVWIGLFIFRENSFDTNLLFYLPGIYLAAGALLFSIGGLHYFSSKLQKVARIIRISGLKVSMVSLFLLTYRIFSGYDERLYENPGLTGNISPELLTGIVLLSTPAIICLLINLFYNPSKSKINYFENGIALGLIIFALVFFLFPVQHNIYTILYNLLFAGLTLALLFVGYRKADISIVNLGTSWISLFIVAKYFDFFWKIMPRSLFFIIGGLALVLGGAAMEKKRRQLKETFKSRKGAGL